jgi:hypothetical protein
VGSPGVVWARPTGFFTRVPFSALEALATQDPPLLDEAADLAAPSWRQYSLVKFHAAIMAIA